jgi:phospholipid transport system substrate-binding protein
MNPFASRLVATAAVGLLTLAVPAPVLGGSSPMEQLRTRVERVTTLLEDPALRQADKAAQRREIRKLADDIFDFEEMSKRALGRHWDTRSAAEREEFVGLFAELLRRSYYSKIERATFEKITFRSERLQSDDEALVRTVVFLPHGEQMGLDYQLIRGNGDRWRVYDLRFEGISLVSNYRSQFSRIIRTSSYESLVSRLKSNQADFAAP